MQTLVTQNHPPMGRAHRQPQGVSPERGGGTIRGLFGGHKTNTQYKGMPGAVRGMPGQAAGRAHGNRYQKKNDVAPF